MSAILTGARSRMTCACGSSEWSDCGKIAFREASPAASVRVSAASSIWSPATRVSAPVCAPSKRTALLEDRVEHRLDIRRRAADDAQDLAGGGLLLERGGQVAVARLELSEQAHVLDGDHGLVGEGLEQLDLGVGEQAGLGAAHRDRADHSSVAQHGGGKQGLNPAEPKCPACSFAEARVVDDVRGMRDRARQRHAPDGEFRIRSLREMSCDFLSCFG